MVTARDRVEYLKKSYQCYRDQTYPNKQLVIVNEGPKSYQNEIVDFIGEPPDVKFIFLDGFYTLGALRNISIALADGDIWVQWDDDDFNMPERLSVQYSYLSNKPKAKICYLTDQLHYYFPTRQLYWENWMKFESAGLKKFGLIPGTAMCRKNTQVKYPSAGTHCSAGEDSIFASQICDNNEESVVLLEEMGCMHVYAYHGKNVWDIEHHSNISKYRSQDSAHIIKYRERICRTIKYLGLQGVTKVMSRDGLVFTYEASQ